MAFGYIIIALFMLAMSFYLIFRLNHLNNVTDSIMKGDVPAIRAGEQLIDNLIEQVRNEKKYLITKDSAFLDIFNIKKKTFLEKIESLEASVTNEETHEGKKNSGFWAFVHKKKRQFLGHLKPLAASVNNEETKTLINQIKELYNKHIAMATREFILMEYQELIPQNPNYEEETKQTIEQLTESINKLILHEQTALFKKMELFQTTVQESTKISLTIILFAIIFGMTFSFFFIRSICFPIKTLRDATERIAHGDLDYRVEVNSNDEIGNLGTAFNQMCNKLKELDQMKSEFISNISHNLKTPLTAILEANELMLDKVAGQLSESQVKLLNISKENTLRLIMMINDLLDISRAEAGLMRYNFQHSNIHDIIHKSIDDIRFLAETKNINIHSAKKDPIPEILLDRAKIAQVLDNILSNAIKFTPNKGAITITVKEAESTPILPILAKQNRLNNVHSFIHVSISDTGIGIPIEYHTKIFDKFQQINSRGKGAIKGTGLGLSIAKHIVLDHGGDIWVENNPMGNGTTFHFTLPAKYDYALNFETRF